MSFQSILRGRGRLWGFVAIGIVLVIPAFGFVLNRPPLYWSETQVLLIEPGVEPSEVGLHPSSFRLVPLAGAVEQDVNGGSQIMRLNQSSAKLYGTGVREGYTIALYNKGNQWSYSFGEPLLIVEAVSHSPDEVTRMNSEAIARIEESTKRLQLRAGVPEDQLATVTVRGVPTGVTNVGPTFDGRVRALLAALGLITIVTAAAAVVVDGLAPKARMTRLAEEQTHRVS